MTKTSLRVFANDSQHWLPVWHITIIMPYCVPFGYTIFSQLQHMGEQLFANSILFMAINFDKFNTFCNICQLSQVSIIITYMTLVPWSANVSQISPTFNLFQKSYFWMVFKCQNVHKLVFYYKTGICTDYLWGNETHALQIFYTLLLSICAYFSAGGISCLPQDNGDNCVVSVTHMVSSHCLPYHPSTTT